jgi:outer membrane protein insertion porin family
LLDSFFKGGETIRGFDRAGYGPRDLSGRRDALGGQTYWAATAEVRFPLPFVPEDLGLSGAVFADAGSLWDATGGAKDALAGCTVSGGKFDGKPCLADDNTIRSSAGVSLMWNSPVGPIRMDFAKTLTKEKYDETQFFRFGAATRF